MRSSRVILVLALLGSLLVHAAALTMTRRVQVGGGRLPLPFAKPVEKTERVVKLVIPDPPPPPKEELFGEKVTKGKAMNELEAPEPQTTPREAETEQAMLSRDPAGRNGEPKPPEPQPQRPEPADQTAQTTLELPPAPQQMVAAPPPMPTVAEAEKKVAASETTAPVPDQQTEQLAMAPPAPKVAERVEKAPPVAPPEPSKATGDAAPESDRDSDAFGPSVAIEMKAGKVSARQGRQLKFARAERNLATDGDIQSLSFPLVIQMQIEIDRTGTPRRVIVTRSTGSVSIDRAFELAAYESWFEPIKARTNRDGREQFSFGIILH